MKKELKRVRSRYEFFKPIPVTEDTIRVLRDAGVEFTKDPPPPLFNIKQVSVEPFKKHVSSLIGLKFEYGTDK